MRERTRLFPPVARMAFLALAALGLAAPRAASAQGPVTADAGIRAADSLVASWTDQQRVPGAVLLVIQDGRVLLEKAYGWRQLYAYGDGEYGLSAVGRHSETALRLLSDPSPMTRETVFDLASVTKVMATTFAVMILVDRGQVSLDAPVSRYLPDFTGGGKEAITVRHLLTHRSGLRQWVPTYYHATRAGEAYAYLRDLPLGWPVGEGRHYSDLGFMVLGRLVEAVSGARLDTFLQDALYLPLGLATTGYRPFRPGSSHVYGGFPYAATSHGNPYEHRMVHDSTFGYRIEGDPDAWDGWRRRTLVGEVNDGNAYHAFGGVAGHAGLFSTARELGVLLQLLLNRGEYDGHRYVGADVVDAFLRPNGGRALPDDPAAAGQALGWQVPDYAPAGSFAHTGFTGTYVLGVPARGLAVVLLTNRQNVGLDDQGRYPDVGPLQRGVARAILGGG